MRASSTLPCGCRGPRFLQEGTTWADVLAPAIAALTPHWVYTHPSATAAGLTSCRSAIGNKNRSTANRVRRGAAVLRAAGDARSVSPLFPQAASIQLMTFAAPGRVDWMPGRWVQAPVL